jgi:hypothetical protein
MADYRAISNGVASDLARWEVWNGAAWVAATVLPTVNDDVYANGRTVTIDVDFFAASYRTLGITGVSAGGGFILNGGVVAIGDARSGLTNCITHSAAQDSWLIGNCFGSTTTATRHGAVASGDGTLHVVGSGTGGSQGGASLVAGSSGVRYTTGAGGFIVYGNAISGSGVRATGAYGGRVLGRAIGFSGTERYGAFDCIVNECASFNANCVVVEKFIHDGNNNLQGLINCRAQVGANIQAIITDGANNQITLNPLFAQDQAATADVRLNTVYANGALTGTLAVPNPATVALGVPTDNTTGTLPTAAVVAADLLSEISSSPDPLAERLRNVSTIQSTGAQLQALSIAP